MASASDALGGAILIAAGVYQWTPLKDVCLTQCQSPLLFLMRHGGFRRDALGSLLLGLRHGAYCVSCCWMLMALLFVSGVMNVLWIALLALLILLEKLFRFGRWIARAAGAVVVIFWKWDEWPLSQNDAAQVHHIVDDAAVPLPVRLSCMEAFMTELADWHITGDWFDNCSCAVACPCTFAQAPDNGFCESVLFWHIRQGHYGDINLDGLSFVRVGRWEGDL
jgi:hypothetical protein